MSEQLIKQALVDLDKSEFSEVADCRGRIKAWLTDNCIDAASRETVAQLIQKRNIAELRESFYRELEFGTGGLRGVIGPGNNRINVYVIRRATQGLANYIKKQGPERMRMGVAIAYDSRNFSDVFAKEAASVLAANSIQVHLFKTLNTTPCLSFAVRRLGCTSGICVTASHNPPQYNGYKVYWDDGAQIVPPVDAGILSEVFAVTAFSQAQHTDFDGALKSGMVKYIDQSVVEAWYDSIAKLRLFPGQKQDVSIVYTPLHGTGAVHAKETLARWGFANVHVVPEQEKPDGRFPTVKKPNPEEPEALALAIEQAEARNADIVLATDPDSDRLAVAVRDPALAHGHLKNQAIGNYVLLNGNQTGAVMIDVLLSSLTAQKRLKPTHKVVKTIVTSELHARVCNHYGVEIFDTLTGFKWIAGLVRDWESAGKATHEYLFGTEESFGYMPGSYVRDKDGIGALCMAAEIAGHLKSQKETMASHLLKLFETYGAWQESLINVDLVGEEGAARIKRMMNAMRSAPKLAFAGSAVARIFDYELRTITKVENGALSKLPEPIKLPKSDVLQFELVDGSRISMRPSGTEPKIKFYISVCTPCSNVSEGYQTTLNRIATLNSEIKSFVDGVK
jgi:phosphoglucomutase